MKFNMNICLAGATTLALAACSEPEEPVVDPIEGEVETAAIVADFDPMTRDYTLDGDAATRRDAFDETAFQEEYAGYRDEVASEQVNMGDDANAANTGDMTEADRAEMEAASQPRDSTTNMRARENMTFAYLDRNDDNKLSVAEYAIWAIPVSPQHEAMNDQGQPELKADSINKAADSFFYYDRDGDTYLDSIELAAARQGQSFET